MPRLSYFISYQSFPEFALVVDHRSGRMLRLNASGGRVLDKLARGDALADAGERRFAESLIAHGLAYDAADASNEAQPPASQGSGGELQPSGASSLMTQLKNWASRECVPVQLQAELTYACPANCIHCYLQDRPAENRTLLARETWFQILTDFRALGGLFVTFTGGEPFARTDFEDIVAHARSLHLAVSILTSGFGASEARVDAVARLGLDGAQVSLHGSKDTAHDAIAGRAGGFVAAWRALRQFKTLGVPVRAAVSVHRENLADIPALMDKLSAAGVRPNFNLMMLPGRGGSDTDRRLGLDDAQAADFLRRYGRRQDFRMNGLGLDDPPCSAARAVLSVDPFGVVAPCLMWRETAGKLTTQSLGTIWRESPVFMRVRALRMGDLSDCLACELRESCNRCPGLARMQGVNEKSRSPLDCRQAGLYHSFRQTKEETHGTTDD